MKRRNFMLGTAALGGALASNLGISSLTFAQGRRSSRAIIKIFQRGGADGLYLFPPFDDPAYRRVRNETRVRPPNGNDATTALRLGNLQSFPNRVRNGSNGQEIGLHPLMGPLRQIWQDGNLMISPATHYNNSSRSHFHTQQVLEFGGDGRSNDGFLNRYLQRVSPRGPGQNSDFRAVRPGVNTQAPVFNGDVTVPVLTSAESFNLESADFCRGSGCADNQLTEKLRTYSNFRSSNELENHIRQADTEIVDTIEITQVAARFETRAGGQEYTNSDIGSGLRLVSQLLKDGQPLEVAALNWAQIGWDTHAAQVARDVPINNLGNPYQRGIAEGARDLLTFYLDMRNSGLLDDVIVIVGSEFGRTVAQNGSLGTDHGFGSTWFAFGGPTRGGVYNAFRSLEPSQLEQGRFVPHNTSFQDIIGEAMSKHLNVRDGELRDIFPGHRFVDNGMFGNRA